MQKHSLFFVLYLFSFYQLCPAIEFAVAKQLHEDKTLLEDNNSRQLQTENLRQHSREKRFLQSLVIAVAAGVISGIVSRLLGDQITKLINGSRLRRSDNRVSLISTRLNLNYNNAMALKQKVTGMNPAVGNAIMVSRDGFKCDREFCAGKQTGHYALGLCSKYMCYCNNGTPGPLECGGGLVFDPMGKNCNYPKSMALCGY